MSDHLQPNPNEPVDSVTTAGTSDTGFCAHLRVLWCTRKLTNGATEGWWACPSCFRVFIPMPPVLPVTVSDKPESRCECGTSMHHNRNTDEWYANIIRCAHCLGLEAENERLKASLTLMTADRNQRDVKRLTAEAENERLKRELFQANSQLSGATTAIVAAQEQLEQAGVTDHPGAYAICLIDRDHLRRQVRELESSLKVAVEALEYTALIQGSASAPVAAKALAEIKEAK